MSSMHVLEKAISLLERKDLDGFLALLSPDCVIMKDDGEVLAKGTEQLHAFYTPIFNEQAQLKIELADQFTTGSVIAVREVNHDMNVNGEIRDVDSVWVYKVIDGKIHYMHVFLLTRRRDLQRTQLAQLSEFRHKFLEASDSAQLAAVASL